MKELRVTRFKVTEEDGREYRYYVVYPYPPAGGGQECMILDEDGEVVECAPEGLSTAAEAAFRRGTGEHLEKWISLLAPSARARAEELGWVGRYGPGRGQILLPDTPVFFFGGLPVGLREQARGSLKKALRLLADKARQYDADPVSVFVEPPSPEEGVTITAAELAGS